LKSLSS